MTFCLLSQAETFDRKYKKGKSVSASVELGLRYFIHYNRVVNISTPPESALAELQLNVWFKDAIALSLSGSTAVALSTATYIGAGIKLQILNLQSSKPMLISGIALVLGADAVFFSLPAPIAPQVYPASGILVRYGGSAHWSLGSGKFFLDTSMTVSTFNNNFFIGPFVGLGVRF